MPGPAPAPRWFAFSMVAPLIVGALVLVTPTAAAAPPLCDRALATITGTNGADWLLGTPGRDVIMGLGGDDHISGLGGDDVICGGGGDDHLHGGRGHDTIHGGAGADRAHGGGGRDRLLGGPGADRLNGGFGGDQTWGNGGPDKCWGEQVRCERKVRTHHRRPAGTQLVFTWRVDPVTEANRGRVASTWRPACPVGLADLRLIRLTHRDQSGRTRTGELVVHRNHVADTVAVMGTLHDARFPIQRMEVVDVFGGDDQASMRANNTSAFNCRTVDGSPDTWSQHAYGRAIDVNPLVNPWVRGSQVDPPEGAAYVVRDPAVPGLIVDGDVVTRSFAARGWGWGGNWVSSKDYQHFSANSRSL